MTTNNAPDRCASRALRIAQVKFVALPMEDLGTGAQSRSGNNPAGRLFTNLLASLIRVIGRLEAARP